MSGQAADRGAPAQFGQLELAPCRHGWMLFHGPFIGKCLELYGEYSESEVALMRIYVKPGDTVIDVGANIGALTLPMAAMVGQGGRVYAVESDPFNFNVLCANLALNGVEHVKPLNAFVATGPETGTQSRFGESYVGRVWPPRFMPLDELGLDSCSFIKIDVDGRELEVLKSAARLIEAARPVLYFEDDLPEVSARLLDYAFGLNYDLYSHRAPIFLEDNFRGNPRNFWAPQVVYSGMVLGVPGEKDLPVPDLPRIEDTGA